MHRPNHVEALLRKIEAEEIPDLRPLLRFLSTVGSSTDCLSSLDFLQQSIDKSSVPEIIKLVSVP